MGKLIGLLLVSFFVLTSCSHTPGPAGERAGKEAVEQTKLAPLPLEETPVLAVPSRDKYTLIRPVLKSLKGFLNR